MKFIRLLIALMVVAFGAVAAPAMAADTGDGTTCTANPNDGSGLPECFTPDDNECYKGGVLYREENQDGCSSLWYWKAGWFLARFNDGKISRSNFPVEFKSVLPPENSGINTICAATNNGAAWTICVHSNQTADETYNGQPRMVLFTDNAANCPSTLNGMTYFAVNTTQGMINFYNFTPAQVASIGGLQPVACYYE